MSPLRAPARPRRRAVCSCHLSAPPRRADGDVLLYPRGTTGLSCSLAGLQHASRRGFGRSTDSLRRRQSALLSDALDLPKPFGPYTLLRRLAVGGMAEVYVAKTKGIGGFEKLVAIKVIHPRFSEDEHFVQMLVEEAKISVQLNHVNIAQTFDLGCIDDTYYIAMEYVEGGDAFRVQKRARERKIALPVDICCYIAAEICNGLGYAHRKRDAEGHPLGIVHRDISPQNVLVSYAGEVKIVDFGIAKAALRGGQTEVGVIKGKYYYMSPEQAWGDPVDHRTDVFATGLLLHELLTGEMVYQEDNVPALLDRVRKAQVPSPRARRGDVSEELAALILKAAAKEASDRFESAHAFGQELTRLLYQINPTFTASRLAQLMGTLFPEEVRRHSQILKLPTEDLVPMPAPPPPTPSEEVELARMRREEFGPAAESSVIFDLDEVEDMTRNDILPFRRVGKQPSRADRPTAELERPAARREEDTTALLRAGRDEWEEETVLKNDKGAWDESTLVDEGGAAMKEVHALFAQQRQEVAGDDEETQDLAGEKTVAMASFPPVPVAPAARPRPPAPRPAAPARPLPPPRSVGARPPPRPGGAWGRAGGAPRGEDRRAGAARRSRRPARGADHGARRGAPGGEDRGVRGGRARARPPRRAAGGAFGRGHPARAGGGQVLRAGHGGSPGAPLVRASALGSLRQRAPAAGAAAAAGARPVRGAAHAPPRTAWRRWASRSPGGSWSPS
ncbi:MAG: serine/threonine protein kinase [Sandaracinaceae bacterium]|nr:serine/threonine protein kinase [Sandaracinaceae bacterium]